MKALVTGGGGFLGGAIVRRLIDRGWQVRSFSRGTYPGLEAAGVDVVQGDLSDRGAVFAAVRGMDIVFHAGAKAGYWGRYEDYYLANVLGTKHVVDACRELGVRKLVYTSSPSVVFDGRDMEGVDETVPRAWSHKSYYSETKSIAERLVIASNGAELATVALRPHLIWGPGDTQIIPRLVARAKAGQLRRIGEKPCRVDSTYIDNAADAHILAAERLEAGAPAAGKSYFISNGEPMPLWDLINAILEAAGAPRVDKSVPAWAAWTAGLALEAVYSGLNLQGEPRMTRFLASELSTAHWFDISAARRDLGYQPKVSVAEGLSRLRHSFSSKEGVPA